MVPIKHLKSKGLTKTRLKEIFTATDTTSDEWRVRRRIEKRISERIRQGAAMSAKTSRRHLAVDLAWDGDTISPEIVPLLMFAQGKIEMRGCAERLTKLGCAEEFVEFDKEKKIKGINMPRLYEVSINLVRSLLMRRIAAQSARYSNLWPYFKYESRSTTMEHRARAAILSSRVDIMADQFGYRRQFVQGIRDMFLYSRTVMFPTCAWEVVKETRVKNIREEYTGEDDQVEYEKVVVREGIDFINPHPTRVYWDISQPLSKLNTDTGPSYVGFWDITRYGAIKNDPAYFNRDCIRYSSWFPELISTHPDMFNYYFAPTALSSVPKEIRNTVATDGMATHNDRNMQIGLFAGNEEDNGLCLANHFERMNPKQEGICDYDGDVWFRFVATADETIVFAEPMPSIPAIYGGINENDNRYSSPSMAHDLLGFQDQLTNILSQLLRDMKTSMIQLWLINKDVLDKEAQDYIKNAIKGDTLYQDPQAMMFSLSEQQAMGLDLDKVVKLIESSASRKIDDAFKAITQLMGLAERLMVLSPQELGQNSQRETSASEVVEIAKSVDTIYTFISDGVDEMRAGGKKMIYEGIQACSVSEIQVPDREMFNKETLEKIGMNVEGGMITGPISSLEHAYIFNSRDGAERTSNVEAAKTLLTSLGNLYPIEDFREFLGKKRLAGIFQEIFRLTGNAEGGNMFELSQEEEEQPVVGGDKANKLLEAIEVIHARLQAVEAQMGAGAGAPSPQRVGSVSPAAPEGAPADPASNPVASAIQAIQSGAPI